MTFLTQSTKWTESSPVDADIDGDASLDVVIGDENGTITAFDIDGNLKAGFPIKIDDAVRATICLADVDQDGDIDMVVHGWDKKIYVYDLPGVYDQSLRPWPMFQANVLNSGKAGIVVTATGVRDASFTFSVVDGAVSLTWQLGATGDDTFEIARSMVQDGVPSIFEVISSNRSATPDGMLRLRDNNVEMGRKYAYRLVSEKDPNQVFTTQPIYVPITRAELRQNYPNPFNPITRIVYYVPEGARDAVSLVVYDVRGARVRTLVSGEKSAGRYEVEWDGRNDNSVAVGSGVYFYRIQQRGFVDTRKMVLIK